MIEKHSFVKTISLLKHYCNGLSELEKCLGTYFDNTWLTMIIDNILSMLTESFFTTEDLEGITVDSEIIDSRITSISSLIYHFCFNGDFGEDTTALTDVYSRGNITMNAYSPESVYDIIIDYLTYTDQDVLFKTCM